MYSMLNSEVKDAGRLVNYDVGLMETMGQRIRVLREAKGLTQEALAEICRVTKSAVSQWEDDTTSNIKLEPFIALYEALGTNPKYLVFGPERAENQPEARRRPR